MLEPNRVIGDGYLDRWYIIPRNKYFNIYLHRFRASDDDRALHDHPWWSMSICLKGSLTELREETIVFFNHFSPECGEWLAVDTPRRIRKWVPYIRRPTTMHRMILNSRTAWTLFITGPRVRDWGFRYPEANNWMHHDEFCMMFGD